MRNQCGSAEEQQNDKERGRKRAEGISGEVESKLEWNVREGSVSVSYTVRKQIRES
jgi:hypothetical protein